MSETLLGFSGRPRAPAFAREYLPTTILWNTFHQFFLPSGLPYKHFSRAWLIYVRIEYDLTDMTDLCHDVQLQLPRFASV